MFCVRTRVEKSDRPWRMLHRKGSIFMRTSSKRLAARFDDFLEAKQFLAESRQNMNTPFA